MTSSEAYRKLNAQTALAERQVQPLLEQLVTELAVARPADPISALIERLEEMEKAEVAAGAPAGSGRPDVGAHALQVRPPRHILSVIGVPGSGKTTQATLAAGTNRHSLLLSVAQLTDEAMQGGVSRKGYEDIPIPQDLQLAVLEAAKQEAPISIATVVALTKNRVELAEQALAAEAQSASSGTTVAPSTDSPASVAAAGRLLFVLDGYPRSLPEAMALEAALGEVSHVVQLGCAPETSSRRTREAGTDDAAVQAQWKLFENSTAPLAEYWRAKRKFTMVDGEADKHECARAIKSILQQA